MLQNAYLLAKIGADTAENEQHFANFLPIGRRVADDGIIDARRGADPNVPPLHVGPLHAAVSSGTEEVGKRLRLSKNL